MEITAVRDLTFTYNNASSPALKDISLSVGRGELVLVCGPSGCGKSTLLRCLKPVLAPKGERSGEILFAGSPAEQLDERRQAEAIGFVSQDPERMIVTDKVWHELAFSLESLGASKSVIRRRTAEMSAFFGLDDLFCSDTATLSGGQKQLLALASAMTTRPELLILDEPTSQLDPISAGKLFDAVKKINRELGTTVIISEHRLEEVFPIADRVVFMREGRIVCDQRPQEPDLSKLDSTALQSLPVPVRIWNGLGGEGSCPLDVSSGREMLAGMLDKEKEYSVPLRSFEVKKEIAVEISKLRFRYRKESSDVLNGLELAVGKGEFFGILGGNGVGKSTLLSVIAGQKKPYCGKLSVNGRALVLPQEPSSLFCRDKLIDDLSEMTSDRELISEVIGLCRLKGLEGRHPFDLSGGELQRAALAKLLLARPDILLLDEPTKGTDQLFKIQLAELIKALCDRGMTVIAVSHDVEFCASYCDRCSMLFSGELLGTASPQEFFTGNLFYTTSAARMTKNLISNAVTADDVLTALGRSIPPTENILPTDKLYKKSETSNGSVKKKKLSKLRLFARIASLAMLAVSAAGCMELIPALKDKKLLPYIMLTVSVIFAAFSFSDGKTAPHTKSKRKKPTVKSVICSLSAAVLIPFTVYAGSAFLNTGKYLFVSLLVMLEAGVAFLFIYEGRRPGTRELVTVAVFTAAAVAGRLAFYMLPQFKPVLAVVVISGAAFGSQTGFLVGSLSMLMSNFMFGQGPWTPWQMFSMGLVGLISGILFGHGIIPKRREIIALFGFFSAVVIYGGIVNPSTLFIMHNEINAGTLAAVYSAGLPLDIIHGAASLGFLYVLAPSVLKKLDRLKAKYDFFE
ncbi:energy-coupling factor transport system ATP-binding protein [Ruminococcaceae bacterium FB2012]|nr:energy-coupling factor transport system ATP-binding protein [Ruminococcaceae bacterium FB2012]